MAMKDRIQTFLQSENKSYAQFAEEIGVQPSGISHILSGRNNPSLDFVIKMLHRYPSLSHEWLLFGRGPMYRQVSQPSLFNDEIPADLTSRYSGVDVVENVESGSGAVVADVSRRDSDGYLRTGRTGTPDSHGSHRATDLDDHPGRDEPDTGARRLTRIVLFYSDKTFTEYTSS